MNRGFCQPLIQGLVLACLLCIGGCAEIKYTLQLDPEFRNNTPARVWPAAPEQARYRYVGQLWGEDNLVPQDAANRGAAVKIFDWLVGLFDGDEPKTTLKRPQSGVADAQGRIYVTDISNHAVFVFDQAAGKLQVWQQALERMKFVTPIGIAIGVDGQILVADAELGLVVRLNQQGKPLGSFGRGLLTRPTGLARDASQGRIFVSDTQAHNIKVFSDDGQLLETWGARGEGEGEELNFPTHLAYAGEKLYIADSMNARVQVFDAQGQYLQTLGKRGRQYGDLTRPKGVTVDGEGNIYVVESLYDNLLVFNPQGQFLMPLGGTGKEIGQFYLPAGLWRDAQDRIYVADMFNGRVVIFQFLGNL